MQSGPLKTNICRTGASTPEQQGVFRCHIVSLTAPRSFPWRVSYCRRHVLRTCCQADRYNRPTPAAAVQRSPVRIMSPLSARRSAPILSGGSPQRQG